MNFKDYFQENGHLTKLGKAWMDGMLKNIAGELPPDMNVSELEVMQASLANEIGNYFSAEIHKKTEAEKKYAKSKFANMTDEEFLNYLDDKNGTDIFASLVSLTPDEMMRYEKTQKWKDKQEEIAAIVQDMKSKSYELPCNGVRFDK